ncbi:MAG TPA: AAA family ATPase [Mycobacteriales bacterium]|nr:AAA family ATPase [Mycobacteriales bacterium]
MDARRPFVGRGAELELLLGRLAAARSGQGGVVLVSGPAGIGKTRLVEEALTRRRGTAAVARAQCWDGGGAPPLWPWTRLAARLAPPLLAALTSGAAPALGVEPGVLAAERFRMLSTATDALLRIAAEQPLVVVLEDVHWADSESLELLRRVSAEIDGTGLLVVATHRDEPAGLVGAAVADIRRGPATTAVGLSPLSPGEVADYLRAVDAPADGDRVGRLHRGTGGLPLLVAAASGADGAAGTDVRAVVAGLLARLTPAQRGILDAVAVLGTVADPELLAEVAGVDTAAVADALTDGRRAGLLDPAGDGPGFSHALVRDEVRRAIVPAVATALHRRAAVAQQYAAKAGVPADRPDNR